MRLDQRQVIMSAMRVCQQAMGKTALTKTWEQLHTHFSIGQLRGRYVHLSEQDREQLRLLIKQRTRIDVLLDDVDAILQADRLELAQRTSNEKVSGHAVSRDRVFLASVSGTFDINGRCVALLPGAAMVCSASAVGSIEHLVVVENLATLYALDQYVWPSECESAIMVFRGSVSRKSRNAVQWSPGAVKPLIDRAQRITFFGDFDPKGIQMALTGARVSGWIAPTEQSIKACCDAGLNQPHTFTKQHEAFRWLLTYYPKHPQIEQVRDARLALMQESLVGKELRYIPR